MIKESVSFCVIEFALKEEGFSYQWENKEGALVYYKNPMPFPIIIPRYTKVYPPVAMSILNLANIEEKKFLSYLKEYEKSLK